MSFINLIDSDSDDEPILNRRGPRTRSSKRRSSVSEDWNEDSSYDEADNDDNDDDIEVLPLRQRLGGRMRQCNASKGGLKSVDMEDDDDDDDGCENLKMPATKFVGDIEMEESSEDEHMHIAAGVSFSPKSSTSTTTSTTTTTRTNATISSSKSKKKKKASPASITKYIKSLQDGVKKRTFPLSQIPNHEVISTGRTIKPLKAWKGHWPALREFLQNTIDHLNLMNSTAGRRQDCLDMNVTTNDDSNDDVLATVSFTCKMEDICKIIISTNDIVIEQLYTYPIASRALDTGVPDSTKSSSKSQAGGFGDGFKTAAVALIANSKKNEFKSLKWCFYATKEKTKIEWNFVGETRDRVATFEKCQVLQVNIDKKTMKPTEVNRILNDYNAETKGGGCSGRDYIMQQTIQLKGIGKSFLNEAIPRLVVFWDLDESSLISMSGRTARSCGGDFIGHTSIQPPLFHGAVNDSFKPKSGVFVKGIYVRPTKIKDTMMCFFGDRLEVSGRDRNEIDEDELIVAVTELIGRCNNIEYLAELLSPLRGTQDDNDSASSHIAKRRRGVTGTKNSSSSWLLQSPRFFNRVIEIQKDFILHDVFKIPRGAIHVSKKTTDSKDPFINWSATFLKRHGAPLVPIAKGANKFLFEEIDRYELTDKCVAILKQLEKGKKSSKGRANQTQTTFRKLLTFMGMGRLKVFFSPEVNVAFVHDSSIFIPESTITRDLVVKVLNVCHSQVEASNGENYSCLLQSIFEKIPASSNKFEDNDAKNVIARAKEVLNESRNFLVNTNNNPPRASQVNTVKEKPASKHPPKSIITLDDSDDEVVSDFGNSSSVGNSSSSDKNNKNEQLVPTTTAHLEEQIKKVTERATSNKRTNDGNKANAVIPESLFENDNAGEDSCLRPSSSLIKVDVGIAFGGGSIWFDEASASQVQSNKFSVGNQNKILSLRKVLDDAKIVVRKSIPSLSTLLGRIKVGYDAKNDTYEGFCDGHQIIVNLFSYLPKLPVSRTLTHDFIIMITHELAHFLEPKAGHGPVWRDTHMKMVMEIMKKLENSG